MDFGAFGDGADRMAEAQAGIPDEAHEFRERVFEAGGLRLLFDQDQDVDVGVGKKLAPAEAADRQHGEVASGCEGLAEGFNGRLLDKLGQAGQHRRGFAGGREMRFGVVPRQGW